MDAFFFIFEDIHLRLNIKYKFSFILQHYVVPKSIYFIIQETLKKYPSFKHWSIGIRLLSIKALFSKKSRLF